MGDEKGALTFIIIPENASKTYTFRLKRGLIYVFGAACLALFCLFAYTMIVQQGLRSKARKAERLEVENSILREKTQKITVLERELARLQHIRNHLYDMAGLSFENEQCRGGGSPEKRLALASTEEKYQPANEELFAGPEEPAFTDTVQMYTTNTPVLWPVRGWVTAEFNEVLPGREKRHTGIDIAAPQGSAILCAASGKVTFAGWDKDLGLVVIVDHKNGLSTLYGHCSEVVVEVGRVVKQGQIVAQLGNTGQSSAPHLHFEIRKDGIAIDPRRYLGP
jgi:murein DD-endopeptidase MepM/ murein hydrolase activator NlpD